jgi:hypothetical protein
MTLRRQNQVDTAACELPPPSVLNMFVVVVAPLIFFTSTVCLACCLGARLPRHHQSSSAAAAAVCLCIQQHDLTVFTIFPLSGHELHYSCMYGKLESLNPVVSPTLFPEYQ